MSKALGIAHISTSDMFPQKPKAEEERPPASKGQGIYRQKLVHAKAVAMIDVYASLSVVATQNNFVRPKINEKRYYRY